MAGEIYPATSGTSGVGARAGIWTVIVTIDGVDQTARVIGDLRIDAEEGAARIADLTIRPPDGQVVTVAAWVGKSITIDIADQSSGSPTDIQRLFSGLIDTPALDLETRTIALRCTDNLQNLVAALDNAAIDALTPGGWHSPAVFDPAATGWGRLQDRLSTRPAACERSIAGALRVTPWAPAPAPHLSFTAEHVLDGSLSVALAARHQLVNEVGISFGYRFPRVKAEAYPIAYQYVAEGNLADHAANLNYWLRRDAVVKAIESAGGTVESITYTALPNQQIGQWIPSSVDSQLCMGFSAEVSFDYVQMIEEKHTITVAAPASIAAVGTRMPGWADEAFADFAKRMPRELPLELKEVKAEPRSGGKSVEAMMAAEAARIEAALPPRCRRLILDERGEDLSTRALARRLEAWQTEGDDVALIVGGPDGLDPALKSTAHETMRLSSLTLPHALVRVMLAEALYRAWSLSKNHPYHRE